MEFLFFDRNFEYGFSDLTLRIGAYARHMAVSRRDDQKVAVGQDMVDAFETVLVEGDVFLRNIRFRDCQLFARYDGDDLFSFDHILDVIIVFVRFISCSTAQFAGVTLDQYLGAVFQVVTADL